MEGSSFGPRFQKIPPNRRNRSPPQCALSAAAGARAKGPQPCPAKVLSRKRGRPKRFNVACAIIPCVLAGYKRIQSSGTVSIVSLIRLNSQQNGISGISRRRRQQGSLRGGQARRRSGGSFLGEGLQGDGPDALSNRSTILPPVPVALSDWRATPRWQPELRLTLAAFILRP